MRVKSNQVRPKFAEVYFMNYFYIFKIYKHQGYGFHAKAKSLSFGTLNWTLNSLTEEVELITISADHYIY